MLPALLFAVLIIAALLASQAVGKRLHKRVTAFNIQPSVSGECSVSLVVSEVVTDRHALVIHVDSTHAELVDHVADVPLGVILDDEVPAAEVDVTPKAIGLLGQYSGTLPAVASAAIVLNAEIVPDPASPGRVKTLPVAAGTYLVIGRAHKAAAAAGDVISFRHHMPISRVVS